MIYLLRHGQTEWNQTGTAQGWLNSPLSEAGKAQMESVSEFVSAKPIEALIC